MLKLVVVVSGVVVAAVLATLFVVPVAGGPEPQLSKPTMADCRAVLRDNPRQPESVKVAWIWASGTYGWGCKYSYADGSSGTAVLSR